MLVTAKEGAKDHNQNFGKGNKDMRKKEVGKREVVKVGGRGEGELRVGRKKKMKERREGERKERVKNKEGREGAERERRR